MENSAKNSRYALKTNRKHYQSCLMGVEKKRKWWKANVAKWIYMILKGDTIKGLTSCNNPQRERKNPQRSTWNNIMERKSEIAEWKYEKRQTQQNKQRRWIQNPLESTAEDAWQYEKRKNVIINKHCWKNTKKMIIKLRRKQGLTGWLIHIQESKFYLTHQNTGTKERKLSDVKKYQCSY